jgi:glycosyltransferase involved in cell wall biosynthesis
VSVLRAQKALQVLIHAAARLAPEFPGLKVVIAGRGEEEERLRALVRELALEETVLLVGQQNDVPDLLAALDVAVCCSDFEGSPLSVMEYMAAGLPVVATRVGGVPELIEEGVHGLLIDPGDPDALARAVASLLRNPALRAEMGARARERQRREFDIDATVRRLETVYEELFRTSRRGRNGRAVA